MKKNTLSIVTSLLAFSIVLGLLAGCSGGENSGTSTPAETVPVQSSETEVPETKPIEPDVPEKDYKGQEFRIFTRGEKMGKFWHKDLAAEMDGDVLHDAIYTRNVTVEEKLGIKIVPVWQDSGSLLTVVQNSVMAGDNSFEVVMAPLNQMYSASRQDLLLNLYTEVPYLDLTKPWWDAHSVSDLTIGDKLYMVTGDHSIMDEETTWVMYFNKDIQKDLRLDDFYDLVNTGKWVNDKFHEICLKATIDKNGDGAITTDDLIGYQGEAFNLPVCLIASGVNFVNRDKDNMPVMIGANEKERMFNAAEAILKWMNDDNASRVESREGWPKALDSLARFTENGSLFMMCGMINVMLFRDMEADFGVLPIPKTDVDQADYFSTVSYSNCDVMSIPKTVSDPEMAGIVMEVFSSESRKIVLPAYYDISLQRKSTRDEESSHMIDLIITGKRFDVCIMYDLGKVRSNLSTMVGTKSSDFASTWASLEPVLTTDLEALRTPAAK